MTLRGKLIIGTVAALLLLGGLLWWQPPAARGNRKYTPSLLAGFSFGVFWFGLGTRWQQRQRTLATMPARRISKAARGLVALRGRVVPPRGVQSAPATGQPCAWYRVGVDREILSARYRDWSEAGAVTAPVALLIEDGHGRARIDGAQLELDRAPHWISPPWRVPAIPAHTQATLAELRLIEKSVLGTGENGRTREWRLRAGEEVQVYGTAVDDPDGSADLLLTDTDGVLILSAKPGTELADGLRGKALAGLWGGGVITVSTAVALAHNFGLFG